MDREEVSALHSSELEKLGSDPKDPGDELWRLSIRIRILKEQLDEFAQRCCEELSLENVCFLEGIQCWCDDILYECCEMYCKKSREEPPERR